MATESVSDATCRYCGQAIGKSERDHIHRIEAENLRELREQAAEELAAKTAELETSRRQAEENAAKLAQELDARVNEQVLAKTADLETARRQAEENAAKLAQELDARVNELVLAKTADLETARHEKETQLERAQKTIETLQRQLDEKPSYVRGAMQESELLALLQKEFPKDRIARISGAGADIEHEVVHNGEECGVILYESKNVQTWNSDFIHKLNKDKLTRKASYAILVSTAFPSKSRDFDMIDGVPIVRPELLIGLVQIIRKALVDVRIRELSGENIGYKHEQLMSYLQSPDFKNKMQNVLRAVGDLEDLQLKERRYHDRLWEDEDKLQKEIRNSTFDVNTEIVGILAGR